MQWHKAVIGQSRELESRDGVFIADRRSLVIGGSYKHFSTGANDLVFATVKLMILPLYVLQLISNYLTES